MFGQQKLGWFLMIWERNLDVKKRYSEAKINPERECEDINAPELLSVHLYFLYY